MVCGMGQERCICGCTIHMHYQQVRECHGSLSVCHLEPVWSETFETIPNDSTFRTADTARRPEQLLTRGFLRPFYAGHHYPSSPALRDHPFHRLQR